MASILYYDCFAGISGDMNLGALIDLGVDKNYFLEELKKLHIEGYTVHIEKGQKKGITGIKVNVLVDDRVNSHEHRNLNNIKSIIDSGDVSKKVKQASLRIFETIAKAEAKVHGKPIDKIYFHEVGAIDSIIDIVGATICHEYLGVDLIMASTIELGGGFAECAHGKLPVPAPATVEILQNIPVKSGMVPFETTTPTGAAILAATVDEFTDNPRFKILKTGYGIGNRETEIPNILRVYRAESTSVNSNALSETCFIIECNIDDMNPEAFDFVLDKLLKEGADDVFLTPIIMKKSRPATKLSVLCNGAINEKIKEIIFLNTTSMGIREYTTNKNMLKRDFSMISTRLGDVKVKKSYWQGKLLHVKPEYEDIKNLAIANNMNINDVYQVINKEIIRIHDK